MTSRLQLFNLSPELTEPILEQVLNDDPLTFSRLRLVSRSYNTLVTPPRYREWTLKTQNMDSPGALAVTKDVVMHTEKISAHEPIHWQIAVDLQSLPGLQSLLWHISSKCGARWERVAIALPIPRSIFRPDVQLFIEDFHIGYSIKIPRCQLESPYHIPTSNLVSFKIGHIPTGVRMRDFARTLVKCENLRSLSCGLDQCTCFPLKFAPGEVMPPLKELYLKKYLWGHSSPYNAPHWNFQQLETLDIIESPLDLFATLVNFSSMSSLRVLKIDGWLTLQLLSEILSQVPQLEQLEIRCGLQYFTSSPFMIPPSFFGDVWTQRPFDTIGESLQKLHSLRKIKIVIRDPYLKPVIFAGPPWEIPGETCPLLETLELDIPIWDEKDMTRILGNYVEPLLVLEAIARFPKLQHLKVHVIRPRGQRRSSSYYEGYKEENVDTQSCKDMAQHFLRHHNLEFSNSIFECLEIQTAFRR